MPVRSEAGFSELYRAQYSSVLAFFRRRVEDPETARDLTAETFRIAWQHWGDERRPDRAWLFGVARNVTGDEYRRLQRERDGFAAVAVDAALVQDAADRREPGVDGADVRAVVAALPASHREVLMLTYWEGLGATEAGRVLGISRSAVWVRLYRARRGFAAGWGSPSLAPAPVTQPEEAP